MKNVSLVIIFFAAITSVLLLAGCQLSKGKLKITDEKTEVSTPTEAKANTQVSDSHEETTTEIYPGTKVTGRIESDLPKPTDFVITYPKITVKSASNARAIQYATEPDQTIAIKKQEDKERRVLLYAAIAFAAIGVILRVVLHTWPALSNGFLLSAGIAGVAWKVAEIPAWMCAMGIAVAVLLILGYKRGEWDANKNGIPDFLEDKK